MTNVESSSWKTDVRDCINKITTKIFTLEDVYRFEKHLSELHPKNNNVKAKIRQQLQLLRDGGIIEFVDDNGTYKKLF